MAFDAGKFLKTPDLEGFDNLKKEELVLLAKHLKLDFRVFMRKQIIKNLVIDKLVVAEFLGEEALELKAENVDAVKLKQLELEHVLKIKQLEKEERLEMEKKLDFVSRLKEKLYTACQIAQKNLKNVQNKIKIWYNKDARDRVFEPGDKVLVFLPVPGHPLPAKYCGPYTIESKINDLNYTVKTPGRRKQNRVCHIHMLKPYVERTNEYESKPVATLAMVKLENNHDKPDVIEPPFSSKTMDQTVRLKNSKILSNLDSKFAHLSFDRREKIKALVFSFKNLFPDVPNKTTAVCHDVDVGDASPIKQHPYRLNPLKHEFMRQEIKK
ncbi:uncharacterized protein LOC127729824 [Mytilus californianus]|uniref:uncharacterized protein LOC127729824 n=1 Tax=Mytilus californianus TaxID=6549 RepID=UPI002246ACDA|nr:uncharacterized protein LOC127729824 [Mytilus californianus]XP_052093706.1 uncharacterized protein LOC127729824 [Mytilus californianus]XP_052093707.1 uncharacterized protein LOC127729824 [Mytilus californianus]